MSSIELTRADLTRLFKKWLAAEATGEEVSWLIGEGWLEIGQGGKCFMTSEGWTKAQAQLRSEA